MERELQSLTLLSGKGGAGKTILILSMARVMSEAGYNVLLVDCDTATHGATYFLESELNSSSDDVKYLSVMELLRYYNPLYDETTNQIASSDIVNRILKSRHGFFFIPSTVDPSGDRSRISITNSSRRARILFDTLFTLPISFDIFIFDCQAGYSAITREAVTRSLRNLIVLEPDAVSSSALRILYLQLGSKLNQNNTYQMFNKLTEEERLVYEKLFGGTLFPNLPPIPFDWEVRAAFATGDIPGIATKWSAFGLGVLRVMRTLFSRQSEKLADLEERTVGKWHDHVSHMLVDLQTQLKRLKYKEIEASRKRRLHRARIASTLAAVVGALISLSPVFQDLLYTYFRSYLLPSMTFYLTIGLAVFMAGYYYYVSTVSQIRSEREQDSAQQSISEIEIEMKKYQTLIATDPRLREYNKGLGLHD